MKKTQKLFRAQEASREAKPSGRRRKARKGGKGKGSTGEKGAGGDGGGGGDGDGDGKADTKPVHEEAEINNTLQVLMRPS